MNAVMCQSFNNTVYLCYQAGCFQEEGKVRAPGYNADSSPLY